MDVTLDELLILLGGKEVELAKLRMELVKAQARIKELEDTLSKGNRKPPVDSNDGQGCKGESAPRSPLSNTRLASA
jgi:hypothetical protein